MREGVAEKLGARASERKRETPKRDRERHTDMEKEIKNRRRREGGGGVILRVLVRLRSVSPAFGAPQGLYHGMSNADRLCVVVGVCVFRSVGRCGLEGPSQV